MNKPDQCNSQFDWSFRTIQIKYQEYIYHITFILKLHVGELDTFIIVDWRTTILNTEHPSCVVVVDMKIYLIQLVFHIRPCSITIVAKYNKVKVHFNWVGMIVRYLTDVNCKWITHICLYTFLCILVHIKYLCNIDHTIEINGLIFFRL